ncbi:MAG TPA: DUF1311 domain-containing protein [Ignavibacteria bacterium]|nr:DUF1311 domain-containing protein [Ignavibacteria bacterium]
MEKTKAAIIPIIIVILFLFANVTTAQNKKVDCKKAVTQTDLNLCAKYSYENAQKNLDELYTKLFNIIKERQNDFANENDLTGKKFVDDFINSQEQWRKYRKSFVGFYSSIYQGGSIQPMIYYNIKTKITEERTNELKDLLEEFSM